MSGQITSFMRICRACGGFTVMVQLNDTTSKCGTCGKLNDITWQPKTHLPEDDLND